METHTTDWEKIFANYIYVTKDLYPEYIKNSCNSIIRRQFNFLNGKDLNRQFNKEDTQISNKHVKIHLISLVIRDMQIKKTQ